MLAVMGQSADTLFGTVNAQLLRIFAAAEEAAAAGGGQPPSRGAKYALNIMLQGMNVPQIAMGLTLVSGRVGCRGWPGAAGAGRAAGRGGPGAGMAAPPRGLSLPAAESWDYFLLLLPSTGLSVCRLAHPNSTTLPPTTPPPQATLRNSVSLLLLRLLDDRGLVHFEEGTTLVKAVNVLMLKILEARCAALKLCSALPAAAGWAGQHRRGQGLVLAQGLRGVPVVCFCCRLASGNAACWHRRPHPPSLLPSPRPHLPIPTHTSTLPLVPACSNRTYAFGALLQLLRDPPVEVAPAQLSKFYDLVVKCLIKLTKSLQANTEVGRADVRSVGGRAGRRVCRAG